LERVFTLDPVFGSHVLAGVFSGVQLGYIHLGHGIHAGIVILGAGALLGGGVLPGDGIVLGDGITITTDSTDITIGLFIAGTTIFTTEIPCDSAISNHVRDRVPQDYQPITHAQLVEETEEQPQAV